MPARLLLVVLCGVLLLRPSAGNACSCAPNPPPQEELARATSVFVGHVVSVSLEDGEERQVAVLKVTGFWKGVTTPVVKVATAWKCCLCGYTLELGRDYLLYAREGQDGTLWITSCSRSATLENAAADLSELGAPEPAPVCASPAETPLVERVRDMNRARTTRQALAALARLPGRKALLVTPLMDGCQTWGYSYGYFSDEMAVARARKECEGGWVHLDGGACVLFAQNDTVHGSPSDVPRCGEESGPPVEGAK